MAKLDRRFLAGSAIGIAVIFAFSYMGMQSGLPTSLPGFVLGVWAYLLIHERRMDLRECMAFPVFFATLYFVFVFVAGLGLVLTGTLSQAIVLNTFPIDLGVCVLLDMALTFGLAALSGAAFHYLHSLLGRA